MSCGGHFISLVSTLCAPEVAGGSRSGLGLGGDETIVSKSSSHLVATSTLSPVAKPCIPTGPAQPSAQAFLASLLLAMPPMLTAAPRKHKGMLRSKAFPHLFGSFLFRAFVRLVLGFAPQGQLFQRERLGCGHSTHPSFKNPAALRW